MAFNLSSSTITKLPMFPAPTTAKERKTISSFVSGRGSSGDGEISRWQGQYLVLLIHCCGRICPTHSMTHQGSSMQVSTKYRLHAQTIRKIRDVSKSCRRAPAAKIHAAHDPTKWSGSLHLPRKFNLDVRLGSCAHGFTYRTRVKRSSAVLVVMDLEQKYCSLGIYLVLSV